MRLFNDPLNGGSFIFTTKDNHQRIHGFTLGARVGEDVDYLRRSIKDGAIYHLHYRPHVLASPRRARKDGRIRLLWKWFVCYLYIKRHDHPIFDEDIIEYPYGQYKGD
jgi:hypothetical protein